MLSTFRNKLKFWSNIALWPVIIAFIAFYGWSFSGNQRNTGVAAAKVGERVISKSEVMQIRERLHRYYQQVYKDNFAKMAQNMDFDKMALDSLIDDALLSSVAQESGIMTSPEEVRETIKSTSYFQKSGQFSPKLYNMALRNMRMSPSQYEQSVEQSISLNKVRTLLGSSAPVTDDELREMYISQNVKINCDYYEFKSNDYLDQVKFEDPELQTYYDENQEEFRKDPQFKIEYVKFSPENYTSQVEITVDDVDDYYNENYENYQTPEQVRASHILLKVDANAPEEKWAETLKKMNDIKKKLDDGASFEDLAKEYSEDSSASKGGDLGYFGKGRMVREFEDAVWNMEVDEVSAPVKTQFGYHLIKKTGYKKAAIQPVEDVESSITSLLKNNAAKDIAMEKAQEMFQNLSDKDSLEKAASENKMEVKTTDFFTRKSPPAELGRSRELDEILGNIELNTVSIPIETFKGVFLFVITDKKESYIAPFEDVKADVEKALKQKKSVAIAMEKAKEIKTELDNGATWESITEKYSMTSNSTGEFSQAGYIPKIGSNKETSDKLFKLNVNDISDVEEVNNRAFIFKVTEKKEFSEDAFVQEKPTLRTQLLAQRQRQAVSSYVNQLKEQYLRDGKLIIYTEQE